MNRILGVLIMGGALSSALPGVADAALGKLTLDWAAGCLTCRTRVERATGPCSGTPTFVEIGDLAPGVLSYVNLPLADGQTFCYRVRHEEGGTFSGYSNTAAGTTGAGPSSLTVR